MTGLHIVWQRKPEDEPEVTEVKKVKTSEAETSGDGEVAIKVVNGSTNGPAVNGNGVENGAAHDEEEKMEASTDTTGDLPVGSIPISSCNAMSLSLN